MDRQTATINISPHRYRGGIKRVSEWVFYCCLTLHEHIFSYISWQEQVKVRQDDVLDQHSNFDFYSAS